MSEYRGNRDAVEASLLVGVPPSEHEFALKAVRKTLLWQVAALQDAIVGLFKVALGRG